MSARILLHVQHLMGIGHQRRAATLARALLARGADVTYVSGGLPVPHIDVGEARFVQLPAARAADATYRDLVDEHGRVVDDAWRARRRERLLAVLDRARPHAIVIETWPFGRGRLRFELEPLVAAARARRPRPALLCSLRDILERRDRPERYREMAEAARATLDRVLVHADPRLAPLEASFPETARIGHLVRYTGYVGERPSPLAGSSIPEVVVSAGGGVVGARLLEAAAQAPRHARCRELRWRLLLGPNAPRTLRARLAARAEPVVVADGYRPDFPALLARCRVSVSQAGYNTVTDVLAARARAVLVPFADARNTEQTVRARLLAERGLATILAPGALTASGLAAAVDRATRAPRPPAGALDLDGAERAAALTLELCAGSVPPPEGLDYDGAAAGLPREPRTPDRSSDRDRTP